MSEAILTRSYKGLTFLFAIVGIFTFAAGCNSAGTEKVEAKDGAKTTAASVDKSDGFDHSGFEALLKEFVDDKGFVDYDGVIGSREKLDNYLKTVATADPSKLKSDDEINAFYINAYNAYTIQDVIDDVYKKTDSVKKVSGFWDSKKHRIAGKELTLDQIEKVSRDLKDPRMHFAVNCASTSCPKLQKFAFTGAKLQEQFKFITEDFLNDEERGLRIDKEKNTVWVSKIFSWYTGDFSGDTSSLGFYAGYLKSQFTAKSAVTFIVTKGPAETVAYFKEKKPAVEYMDYDWTINSQVPPSKK